MAAEDLGSTLAVDEVFCRDPYELEGPVTSDKDETLEPDKPV